MSKCEWKIKSWEFYNERKQGFFFFFWIEVEAYSNFRLDLDTLGRGGLKACLMTNCCNVIRNLPPWTVQPRAAFLLHQLHLQQTPWPWSSIPCRGRQISPIPVPKDHPPANHNSSVFCLFWAGACVSHLEEEGGCSGHWGLTPCFAQHIRHTLSNSDE